MSILILQDHLRGGGTERQSILLTQALIQHELPAKLLVGYAGGKLDDLARENLNEHLVFLSQSKTLHSIKALHWILRNTPSHPYILICMGRWAHTMLGCLPRAPHRSIISTVRTSRPLPWLYKRAIRQSDYLITNSHWALEYTRKQCQLPLDAASVMHNGLSRPELLLLDAKQKPAAKQRLQIDPESTILLNTARLEPGKGQAGLIGALAQIEDINVELWLLGEGPQRAQLELLCASLGVKGRVRFLGFQQNISDYLLAADIFVSASQLDSLPNALIEAHAASLPIVSYPTSGIPEIVAHNQTGLLTELPQPSELCKAIKTLTANPALSHKMGEAARTKIRAEFDPTQQNAAFCQLLTERLASHVKNHRS